LFSKEEWPLFDEGKDRTQNSNEKLNHDAEKCEACITGQISIGVSWNLPEEVHAKNG
jgi:hypothetical protein